MLTVLTLVVAAMACVIVSVLIDARQNRSINARFAAMDRAAVRNASSCEICNRTAVYVCPICAVPVGDHTHEHDYICDTHGFVNPIRQHDGARIDGSGC